MAARPSRRPAGARARRAWADPAHPAPGPLTADLDARPTLAGCRVQLAGELGAGPAGTVTGIPQDLALRWVHFDGDAGAHLCPLAWLVRLP